MNFLKIFFIFLFILEPCFGSDISVSLQHNENTHSLQLSVKRKTANIPWSFQNTHLNYSQTLVPESMDDPKVFSHGMQAWTDGQGFLFQVAELSFLVSWADGTVYVKNKGERLMTQSLMLSVPEKVVFINGGFQEPLSVEATAIEVAHGLNLGDFHWKGKNTQDLLVQEGAQLTVKNCDISAKLVNHGTIFIQGIDQGPGKIHAFALENKGLIDGRSLSLLQIDTEMVNQEANSHIRSALPFTIQAAQVRNFGVINSTTSITMQVSGLLENHRTILALDQCKFHVGALKNSGSIRCMGLPAPELHLQFKERPGFDPAFDGTGGRISSDGSLSIEFQKKFPIQDLGEMIAKSFIFRIPQEEMDYESFTVQELLDN